MNPQAELSDVYLSAFVFQHMAAIDLTLTDAQERTFDMAGAFDPPWPPGLHCFPS